MMAQMDSADGKGAPFEVVYSCARAGFALHWLKPRSKAPLTDGWSRAPVPDPDGLRRTYKQGYNVGVRLGEPSAVAGGFLHVLDIDIRVDDLADEAWDAVRALLGDIDPDSLPCVASGSDGASRHLYFVSERAFYSRKLVVSEGKHRDNGRWRYDYEIELFGTGKQVAMPPSIHPDTGKEYTWERPFDFDLLAMGIAPMVSAERLEKMADAVSETYEFETIEPLTFKQGQLEKELGEIADERIDDYADWITLGQALHHQFGGSREGYDLWVKHSKRSEKFNEREMPAKWRGFGRNRRRPVTMATVRQWVLDDRRQAFVDSFDDAFDDLDDDEDTVTTGIPSEDIEDLLGGTSEIDPLDADVDDVEEDPLDAPVKLPWFSLLDINADTGAIRPNLHNVTLLVRNDPRIAGVPEFNLFTGEIVQRKPIAEKAASRKNAAKPVSQLKTDVWRVEDSVNGTLWTDSRDDDIRRVFEAPKTQGGYGIKVSDRDLTAAINIIAKENSFHPVREYLNRLKWDGKPRAERLFIDYLGADTTPYTREIARLTLIAAVCRVYEPGHKFDFAVIIEGLQGRGKSTFIQTLGINWFAELDGNFSDTKQMIELMQGAWILEIPELSGFNRADVRNIKAFISRTKDRARLAYARRAAEFPRQSIFIGSTNDRKYLKDDTGGRRFWPVQCNVKTVDFVGLRANVDQIWAEVLTMYRQMRSDEPSGTLPLYLTDPDAVSEAVALQESRTVESSEVMLAGTIEAWLNKPKQTGGLADDEGKVRDVTCLKEIWVECLDKPQNDYDQRFSQLIGRAMDLLPHWKQEGQMNHKVFGKQRAYRRTLV